MSGACATENAVDPQLSFEGKFRLSIVVTPQRYYVAADPAMGVIQFTTQVADAVPLSLYRVLNAGLPNVFMLQGAPTADPAPAWAGQFFALFGSAGDASAWLFAEYRLGAQFQCDFRPDGVRFRAVSVDRYMLARKPPGSPVNLWLVDKGSPFEAATWQLEPVTIWSDASMAGKDLRYVHSLRRQCKGKNSYAGAQLQRADFSGAQIAGSNFTGARCDAANFIDATLTEADFTDATVTGTWFTGADANKAKFPRRTFTGAHLGRSSSGRRTSLVEATLNEAIFDGCDLSDADLSSATLTSASFAGATANGADFSSAKLADAKFPRVQANGARFVAATMERAVLTTAALANAKFNRAVLTSASLAGATFGTPTQDAQRTDFSDATLFEIDFSDCDLRPVLIAKPANLHSSATATPATARRALLCRATVPLAMLGTTSWRMLDLTGATIDGALPASLAGFVGDYCNFPEGYDLRNRDLSNATFQHARLVRVQMDGCTTDGKVDFSDANLRRARMPNVSFARALFNRAALHGINFSAATLDFAQFVSAHLDTLDDTESTPPVTLIADLSYAHLLDANFDGAFLGRGRTSAAGANLSYVTFYGDGAKLTNATLDGVQFANAYLAGIDFTGNQSKSLENVVFSGACLANCVLNNASLLNAMLTNACLLGTDLREARLHGAKMKGAHLNTQMMTLIATPPGGSDVEIDCPPTRVEDHSTDGDTTCPAGGNGPCGGKWRRDGGMLVKKAM